MLDNTQKLYFIVYFSSAKNKLTESELDELMTKARKKNSLTGVTGMLLYHDGNFAQVLEGDKKTIDALYKLILEDERHFQIIKMKEGTQEKRVFPDWSMAFYPLKSEHFVNKEGFRFLFQDNIFADYETYFNHPSLILLKSFFESQPIYRRLHLL